MSRFKMKRRSNVEFIGKAESKQGGLNQFVQKHLKRKSLAAK